MDEPKFERCLIKTRGGVFCEVDKRDCMRCGWNYEVEKQREEKLFNKTKSEEEQESNAD